MTKSDYLMHHGIKGQKWYRRRFQNEDGSLTPEGRIRYGVKGEKDEPAAAPKNPVKEMEDADLIRTINRMNLERSYYESVLGYNSAMSRYRGMIAEQNKTKFQKFMDSGLGKKLTDKVLDEVSRSISDAGSKWIKDKMYPKEKKKSWQELLNEDPKNLSAEELRDLGNLMDSLGKIEKQRNKKN